MGCHQAGSILIAAAAVSILINLATQEQALGLSLISSHVIA